MKVISFISRLMNYIAIGMLALLMLLTVADVCMRFIFDNPIKGTSEMASIMMTSIVLIAAWCGIKESHIAVDMIMKRFSLRVQTIVDIITLILGLFIWIIFTWAAVAQALWEKQVKGIVGVTIDWPSYPFYLIYALGLAMLCLVVVALIIQKLQRGVKP